MLKLLLNIKKIQKCNKEFCNYFWESLYNLIREHFRLKSYRNDCPYKPSDNSTGMTEVIYQNSPALLKHIDTYTM